MVPQVSSTGLLARALQGSAQAPSSGTPTEVLVRHCFCPPWPPGPGAQPARALPLSHTPHARPLAHRRPLRAKHTCKLDVKLVLRLEDLDVERAVGSKVLHSPGAQNGLVVLRQGGHGRC